DLPRVLGRLGVQLDADDRAPEALDQDLRHVAGGAAQLEDSLARADQAEDAGVGVVGPEIDLIVVPEGRRVAAAAAFHQACTSLGRGSRTFEWMTGPPGGWCTSNTSALSIQSK